MFYKAGEPKKFDDLISASTINKPDFIVINRGFGMSEGWVGQDAFKNKNAWRSPALYTDFPRNDGSPL